MRVVCPDSGLETMTLVNSSGDDRKYRGVIGLALPQPREDGKHSLGRGITRQQHQRSGAVDG